jgi:acetoacetyl-CoA synthetase
MPAEVLWEPPPDVRDTTRIGAYLAWLEQHRGLMFGTYDELWRWSVSDLEGFWSSIWEHLGVQASVPYERVLSSRNLPGARWFEGARLSYPQHALARRGDDPAIIARSQTRDPIELTWDELAGAVARAQAGLARLGVRPGDRVAAYLPNVPETVVAFLATAALGAIWSSCAPEFGVTAVLDRFGQIEPSVLLVVDGYRYGARAIDRLADAARIASGLGSLRATVTLPYLDPTTNPIAAGSAAVAVTWDQLLAEAGEPGGPADPGDASPAFEQVAPDHPLYVLYSSGTTGPPKAIVHGHGGILLEHLKVLALHADLGPGDRFCWFTTTGWMMWNYLVSGLTVGSTIVLVDGDPGYPDLGMLWGLAGRTGTTWLGVSAPFLMACRRAGLHPRELADLSALRAVGSTGAPLPAEGFHWVYEELGPAVLLSSVSGGTDVCSAFVGACPLVPVRAGEIPCRYLGVAVEAVDDTGRPVVAEQGELVVSAPMPSMPVGFWGDDDGSRYRAAYFEDLPGRWRHGDWITLTPEGGCVITGRSDATLNRGGVRIGTAEIYAVVESVPGVADSLVVHEEDPAGGPGRLVLFVALGEGARFDEELAARIRAELRAALSPRHAPDEIHEIPTIPTTLSGKKLEVPVKRILASAEPDQVASRDSLRDPRALDAVAEVARTRRRHGR